ncbi:siroheme synthase CysG [Jannaschia aquimarina]|uniref:CysG_2 protein n=1 Tax=Jannaschia aquimarina TaxID=935700 RepID=A0A0D1EBD8_9RHOB|nr:siroheme synthase CysG [Jannaschia aquimarina]KIT15059.1 Siroheme synthase [Jannaschia aquimarina]SNS63033.1 uroporphyrin-III C-methyltransferase / precorrin-2 dehydrogenase / sirohydrochlorin ferrochelatase [Jannaschia aquimarina]
MKSFPMFLRTSDRTVVIVGGGEQAAQKARLMLKTDAALRLVAPSLDAELAGAVSQGRAVHHDGPVTADTFSDAAFAFVATGCVGADAAFHALAKQAGVLVNVVDRPDLCDMTTPSIVDRDPVVVAIGTEGTAPVLARAIKTRVETLLPQGVGGLAALAGRLRGAVAERLPESTRRAFWAWVFNGEPARLHASGSEKAAAEMVKSAIAEARLPEGAGEGHIALVGAGPGARDLLTLRAVQRLQEADIIFYDRLVDPGVLELARRDAERVFVGKAVGACAWPQERICALIAAEARKGRRVVRLKSGDPSIFGRATEELDAARRSGIAVEIVPGVTAASAAASAIGRSLTERGETDTLIIATGTCRPDDAGVDWAHHVRPGTTLAIYMGVRAAPQIAADLQAGGAGPATPVDIVANASTAAERVMTCTLSSLGATLAENGVGGVALILVRLPKSLAASAVIAA